MITVNSNTEVSQPPVLGVAVKIRSDRKPDVTILLRVIIAMGEDLIYGTVSNEESRDSLARKVAVHGKNMDELAAAAKELVEDA